VTVTPSGDGQPPAAAAFVTEDADVLGGQPCIRHTRIPVHDIAASVKAGISVAEILAGYPDLTAEDIALAVAYATDNPLAGRPRRVTDTWPNATVREERVVRRAMTEHRE
jgi:uncharacterized protein (DUF433 family)